MTGRPAAAIQPHGFLLVLSDDWLIERASLNVGDLLGRDPRELIGVPASTLLSVDAIHALRNRLALLRGPDAIERVFRCRLIDDDRFFDVAVHRAGNSTILEAEPSSGLACSDNSGTVRGLIARLDFATSLAEMLEAGARQLRAITGFDRVIVTRFDAHGCGEVVAECARSGIGTMIGARTPASTPDTLELYRRAPLHVIADVEIAPVPVIPEFDVAGDPLDLSLAVLRADPPERLDALRVGDIRSAMSLSLVVGGKLWGVIDCHHHFARSLGFERRAMADLFAQMFALRIRICELESQR